MARVEIPYYVVKRGRAFWQPTKRMKQLGFASVPLGADGPEAWRRAWELNEEWQRVRRGEDSPRVGVHPPGSLGAIFARYRLTTAWARKADATRYEWECRAWPHIDPVFGDCAVKTISLDLIDGFHASLCERLNTREAHRAIKVLRALFNVAIAYREISENPTIGIRNRAPAPRAARWREGEAVRLVKAAWRDGYRGLACIIAIAWDTQLSPVDVRSLTPAGARQDAGGLYFEVRRTKTGAAAIGTLSRRSERLLAAYLANAGAATLPDAPLFRNRSGRAYTKDKLAADFRAIREAVFGAGETRKLADMRRSGAMEAVAGGANPAQLQAKMGNTIASANTLWRTYAPADLAPVRLADEARRRGRREPRGNETG